MWLFDTSPFVPRWHCGDWDEGLGLTLIRSDIAIWLAYVLIPIGGYRYAKRWGLFSDRSTCWAVWLCIAFVFLCGLTHLLNAVMFHYPLYRLLAAVEVLTAGASLGTAYALPYLCNKISVRMETNGRTEPRPAGVAGAGEDPSAPADRNE